MARETLAKVMPLVFKHEGGYVDHPQDPGSATKYGITLATLSSFRGRQVTKADVKALTPSQAQEIYEARYWKAVRGDDLPVGVDYAVLDFGINSGPARAIKFLQSVLDVTSDGVIGPETLAAVRRADPVTLINDLCNVRLTFLKSLKTWATFGKGWSARVASVRTEACRLAVEARASVPPDIVPVPPKPTTAPPRGFFHALGKLLEALLSAFRRK